MNKRSKSENFLIKLPNHSQSIKKQSLNISRSNFAPLQSKSIIIHPQFSNLSSNIQSEEFNKTNMGYKISKQKHKSRYEDTIQNKQNQSPNIFTNIGRDWKQNIDCRKIYERKSVYQEYKQRINKAINNGNSSQQEGNPQLKLLKKQNQSLKNEIINGINRLRLVRKMSQKSLDRVDSCKDIKKINKSQNVEVKMVKQSVEHKRKISQIYKQRLARIV